MLTEFIITSGQTRAQFADALGISKSYLSLLENGHKVPGLDLAVRIERLTQGVVTASSWVKVDATEFEAEAPSSQPGTAEGGRRGLEAPELPSTKQENSHDFQS